MTAWSSLEFVVKERVGLADTILGLQRIVSRTAADVPQRMGLKMVMMSLRKPDPTVLRRFLDHEAQREFSYPEVGATASTPPSGYVIDRTQLELGMGESIFRAAKVALQRWQQFPSGWVDLWPRNAVAQDLHRLASCSRARRFAHPCRRCNHYIVI